MLGEEGVMGYMWIGFGSINNGENDVILEFK